jgi:hypothetical protein
VEYGECFNSVHFLDKTGVDPDPKFKPGIGQLFKLTSDQFFETKGERIFDVIFIDGMHQSEYILRDINNSIRFLAEDGFIFIDDILPFNYNEQLKIPIKHYYENGILKYAENWTGDVWKVIYYMLLKHKDKISLCEYYYNIHFRGVCVLKFKEKFQLKEEDIHIINEYDYFIDYNHYVKLLQKE